MQRGGSSPGYRAPEDCAITPQRAQTSLGVESSFRASATRYRLGWPSPIHLQPLPSSPKAGRRLLASSRRRLGRVHRSKPDTSISRGLTLSLRVFILRASLPSARPEDRASFRDPLMRLLAPSAHQAGRIHLHGLPHPLWSAFAVGPALTVSSPPDPAGLFHPAALMGFQGSLRLDSAAPEGPSDDTQATQRSLFLPRPARARPKPNSVAAAASLGAPRPPRRTVTRLQGRCGTGTTRGRSDRCIERESTLS